jgi:septum formation protein
MTAPAPSAAVLFLASTSPRRSELLRAAGIRFQPIAPGPEPRAGGGSPAERARERAFRKAHPARLPAARGWILAADTVVALAGREYGKPADATEAAAMLRALAGREHEVHTGHCLLDIHSGGCDEELRSARVRCAPLDEAAIRAQVARGDWRGKAGAYGIQDPGTDFMTIVEGDLDTVVGLSIDAVRRLLARAGAALP